MSSSAASPRTGCSQRCSCWLGRLRWQALAAPGERRGSKRFHPKPRPDPRPKIRLQVGGFHAGRAPIYATRPGQGHDLPLRRPASRVVVNFYLDCSARSKPHDRRSARAPPRTGVFQTSVVIHTRGRHATRSVPPHAADADPRPRERPPRTRLAGALYPFTPVQCGDVVGGFKAALAKMNYVSGGGALLQRPASAARSSPTAKSTGWPAISRPAPSRAGGLRRSRRLPVRHPAARRSTPKCRSQCRSSSSQRRSRPFAIYPVSTGKPSTPTVTGHYHFYLRSPGYNSEGMYYSFYWYRGYAVHGYAEVPNYPASHGCVRTLHRRPAPHLLRTAPGREHLRLLVPRSRALVVVRLR